MRPRPKDPTWGEIVWGQFARRRLPLLAFLGVGVLWLVAVACPLVASDQPFLWQVDGGRWESPWLLNLFNRLSYETGIDVAFNCLLVALPALLPLVWVGWTRSARLPGRRRASKRLGTLALAAAVWASCLAVALAARHQATPVRYPQEQARLEATGHEVRAVYAPLPFLPSSQGLSRSLEAPSTRHPLGTDSAGQDVLTRLLYGTRISLTVGVFAVLLYCTAGTLLGALAGYYGGRVDLVVVRVVEVFLCIPPLFLVLTLAAFVEARSVFHVVVIIAAVAWTGPARLVRAEFLRLRQLDFAVAARAAGYGEGAIIFREILPNALGPVLVNATFGVASAILVESTVSFLGVGDITAPSWGQVLSAGRSTGTWTLILAPGFAIFLTVGLLNLVGEGLRDAMDPRLRQ
jgi:peptide/nickel transport system permease protein